MNIAKALVLSHVSEAYAPTYPFLRYLKFKKIDVDCILHPLVGTKINKSIASNYSNNQEKIISLRRYSLPIKILDYMLHFYLNLKWVFRSHHNYDIVFGLNSVNALSGLILRLFGKTNAVVYYSVDYSTNRFNNIFLNKIYYWLDNFCVKYCDYTFSVSERIRTVRRCQGLEENRNILQSNGVHMSDIKIIEKDNHYPIKIVYAGHITKSKGIDLLIGAFVLLRNRDKFKLDIYGTGPFFDELKRIIKEKKLENHVFLKGSVENSVITSLLYTYHIGVALYTTDDQFNYYCDPVKVKEYIAAKNIILISDVPEIADEIESLGIGFKISNDIKVIAEQLENLSDLTIIKQMIGNFEKIDFEIDWYALFEKSLTLLKNK